MAGIKQDLDGKWKIDPAFLTPERVAVLERLDEKHEAVKAAKETQR